MTAGTSHDVEAPGSQEPDDHDDEQDLEEGESPEASAGPRVSDDAALEAGDPSDAATDEPADTASGEGSAPEPAGDEGPHPLTPLFDGFATLHQIAEELLDLTSPAQHNTAVSTLRGYLFQVAGQAKTGAEYVAYIMANPHELEAPVRTDDDDPGDLTCPVCDGPITLAALTGAGRCDTCEAGVGAGASS